MRIMRQFPALLLAISMVAHVRAAQPAPAEPPPAKAKVTAADLFGDSVVAKGKGFEIKRSQLDDGVSRYRSQAASQGRNFSPEHVGMIEQAVLNQLIQIQLLLGKANEADKTAGQAEAKKMLAQAQTKLGSEEALNRELKINGATREEVMAQWADGVTAEAVVRRELKISVTDADARSE